MSPVFSRSRVSLSKNLSTFSNLNNWLFQFTNSTCKLLSKSSELATIFTFVLVSLLLVLQVGGQAGNLISPLIQQKSALSNLLRTLGLENKVKASAQVATPTYFVIQSTDTAGTGFKISTSDIAGTENSNVKFTNSVISDQQRWYFDTTTKLIKSAIPNKCLATTNNQVWNPIIIKTCNANDNTQTWDTTGNLIKNIFTSKCVNAAWSNLNGSYQNLWFDGRVAQLNDGCVDVGFNFVALPNVTNSSSVLSNSSVQYSSQVVIAPSSKASSSSSTLSSQSFYTIESTDPTGIGYKMTTTDQVGTDNSPINFTNLSTFNDQQGWYFDTATKLIKSAIANKCLATIANQLYTSLVLKTCNTVYNTQVWDSASDLIKNLATGKCAVASWTQNPITLAWENKWFDGRSAGLDDGCNWGFKFVATAGNGSQSSAVNSAISSTISNVVSLSSVAKSSLANSLSSATTLPTQQYFFIDTLDTTGMGYKLSTNDTIGTENSSVKFTNSLTVNDQQRWYFDNTTKLIKSAITNKCLATTNNLVWNPIILKTCNPADNTQTWDIAGEIIKNLATGNCVAAAWSQIGTTGSYENRWFEGRTMNLDNSCYWSYKFSPLATSSQTSSSSTSSSSFVSVNQPTFLTYQENGIDLTVAVACTDDGEMVSGQQSFSMVVQYTNNGERVELVNSRLIPDRPVIHTHFDRKDKDSLNYSDANISTKLSGPVTYLKGNSGNVGVSATVEPRAMIIQGLGSETVAWKFNILDATGNPIKNTAGIARDFEVATDRNFATKCAKPTVKIVDTTNPPVNTIDPKYVLPDYCSDTSVTSSVSSSSMVVVSSGLSQASSTNSISSVPACIPRPASTDINIAVNAKFVFERVGETDPTNNPDGSRSISLFGPITTYKDKYSLALDIDPEFEDQLGTNGLPTGQKTTKAKNEAALEGIEVKFIDSTTMKRGLDASGNQTLGTDKISKYWLYDLSAGQIRSAIDGFCLATKFVNNETNKITNKLVLKKCTTNNGTTSSLSIDPTQDWEMPKAAQDDYKRLKPSNSEYCLGHTLDTYAIYFDKICTDQTYFWTDVKSVVDLKNYNLIQKSAQESITSNKTALTKADGSVNLTYSRIANFDGSKVMTAWESNGGIAFRAADTNAFAKGQYWYYEPSSRMVYSDYYNQCLTSFYINRSDTSSVNNLNVKDNGVDPILTFRITKCDTTDNRQKFLFYKDPVNNYNTIRAIGVRDPNYIAPTVSPTTTVEIEKDYANRFMCMSGGFNIGAINVDNFDRIDAKPCRSSPINNNDSATIAKSAAYAYRELFNINTAANSPTKPITSKALPLVSIISKMDKNNKKWKLDVKDGVIGDNSQIQIWEAFDGNPNQTFSYNTETNEIYWEPERELGTGTAAQTIKVKVPRDVNTGTSITTVIDEIEVPISTYKGSKDMKCIAVAGNASDPSTYDTYKNQGVVIKPCDGSAKQRFEFTYLGNNINKPIIKSLYSNTCIDSQGTWWTQWDNTLNGTKAMMNDCNGLQSQLYRALEKGKLLADAGSDEDNQNIFQNTFAKFSDMVSNTVKASADTTGYFYISSFFNQNFVIDIPYNNVVNQQELWLYLRNNSPAQKWITTGRDAEIKNETGKCFDSGNGQVGQALRIHQCTGSWNQRWTLYTDGTIIQPQTGLCISLKTTGYVKAVPYADIKNGTPIKMAQCYSDNCSIYWQVSGVGPVNTSIVDRDCMRDASINYLPYLDPGSSYNNPGTSGSPLPNSNPNQNPPPTSTGVTSTSGGTGSVIIINGGGGSTTPTTNTTPPPYVPPTTVTPPQTTTGMGTGIGINTNNGFCTINCPGTIPLNILPNIDYLRNVNPPVRIFAKDLYPKAITAYDSLVSDKNEILSGITSCGYNIPCTNNSSVFKSALNNATLGIAGLLAGLGVGLTIDAVFTQLIQGIFSNPLTAAIGVVGIYLLILLAIKNIDAIIYEIAKDLDTFVTLPFFLKMFYLGSNIGGLVGGIKALAQGALGSIAGMQALVRSIKTFSEGFTYSAEQLASRYIGGFLPRTLLPVYDYGGTGVAKASGNSAFNFFANSSDEAIEAGLGEIAEGGWKEAALKFFKNPTKSNSPIWKNLSNYRGKTKTNGLSGSDKKFYEWDYTHNDIEIYNKNGIHEGSIDPLTGELIKLPVAGRTINI